MPTIRKRTRPHLPVNALPKNIAPSYRREHSLAVEYVDANDLKRRNRHVHKHSDQQIALLAKSMKTFGNIVPVLIDKNDFIISGHARVHAAVAAGFEKVPAIRVEHLSDAEARAFAIADKKLSEMGEWDMSVLADELQDFISLDLAGELSFDLDVLGFSTPELDIILDDKSDGEGQAEIVEIPEPYSAPVCRPGDLWVLGTHKILCGNALVAENYTLLLANKKVRLALSDPPFNLRIDHVVSGTGRHREFAMASGEMSPQEFDTFLNQALATMSTTALDGAVIMIFMDWRHVHQLINAGEAQGLRLINLCVWAKNNGGMGSLYRSQHELIAVFRYGTAPNVNNVELGRHGRYRTNVWKYAGVNTFRKGRAEDLADHPTVKPTPMLMDAIRDVTHHGDLILDSFGGSGSTLLAAERTGRRARLIEIDPIYVDVTIRRWQNLTGKTAVNAETGEFWDDRAAAIEADDDVEPNASAPAEGAPDVQA